MKKKGIALLLSIAVVASLAGCGKSAETESAAPAAESSAEAEASTEEAAQGGGELVIYSPNSEGLMNATIPLFEESKSRSDPGRYR